MTDKERKVQERKDKKTDILIEKEKRKLERQEDIGKMKDRYR